MNISLNGYGENAATFAATEKVKVGMPVKLSANGTVAECTVGDKFCGVVLSVRGGYAAVQLAGYVVLKYTGTDPVVGYSGLCADGEGGIKADKVNGRELLITEVNSVVKTCGTIL